LGGIVQDFRKLEVWKKSHILTLEVYKLTRGFPKDELYGLVSQMRRSASSVPTNIAEGCGRESSTELARFLTIASGSASELEYQFLLARDLEYISEIDYKNLDNQVNHIRRMLNSLHQKVKPKNE
jgi:four helix bundle protein